MTTKSDDKIDITISYIYKGLIIITPLFFLTWTAKGLGMDNFNKLYLLWLLVPILFLLKFYNDYQQKNLNFVKTILIWPILLFVVAVLLASLVSINKFASFWGGAGIVSSPFFALAIFVLFFFFNINYFQTSRSVNIIKCLLFSYAFTLAGAVLVFFGLLSHVTKVSNYFQLAAGSLSELAMYVAVMSVLLLGVLLTNNWNYGVQLTKWQARFIRICLALSLFLLVIINLPAAWASLLTGVLFIGSVLFLIKRQEWKEKIGKQLVIKKIFWPILFLTVALIYLGVDLFLFDSSITTRSFAQSLRLDYANAEQVTWQSLKHKPLLGYGPESLTDANSLWRNQSLNSTEFWNLRFVQSPSYFLEIIITSGLLSVIGYLLIVSAFILLLVQLIKKIKRAQQQPNKMLPVILFAALTLSLIIGQLFFSVNIVLLFLFWLCLSSFAVSLSELSGDKKVLVISGNKLRTQIAAAIAPILFLLWILFAAFSAKYWLANFYYQRGSTLSANNRDKAIGSLEAAIKFNPSQYIYATTLSRLYLDGGMAEIKSLKQGRGNLQDVQADFESSIKTGLQAIADAPNSVVPYENLGGIYRDLGSYLSNANQLAIVSFAKAVALEPANPVLLTEMGKIYFKTNQMDLANAVLQKAIALKDDYYDAKFSLAKVDNEQGKFGEATVLLNDLENKYDPTLVYYEEGRVFYNQQNYSQAINKFHQALTISPNYANALYSLGLAFTQAGDNQQALYYFKKVSQLDPQNTEVKKKIEELGKKK
jgi:tetratricopeptide (TPR) repeat protein